MGTVSDLFRLTLTSCYLFPGFVFYYFSNLCYTLSPIYALLFPKFVFQYFPNLCSSISPFCVPAFPQLVFYYFPNLCPTLSPICVIFFPMRSKIARKSTSEHKKDRRRELWITEAQIIRVFVIRHIPKWPQALPRLTEVIVQRDFYLRVCPRCVLILTAENDRGWLAVKASVASDPRSVYLSFSTLVNPATPFWIEISMLPAGISLVRTISCFLHAVTRSTIWQP